jgi:hypothetical protein
MSKDKKTSEKWIYIVALIVGIPLAIYMNMTDKLTLLGQLWNLIIIPFFIAIGLILIVEVIKTFLSTSIHDSDAKETKLLLPVIILTIGLTSKKAYIIWAGFISAGIAFITYIKMQYNEKLFEDYELYIKNEINNYLSKVPEEELKNVKLSLHNDLKNQYGQNYKHLDKKVVDIHKDIYLRKLIWGDKFLRFNEWLEQKKTKNNQN